MRRCQVPAAAGGDVWSRLLSRAPGVIPKRVEDGGSVLCPSEHASASSPVDASDLILEVDTRVCRQRCTARAPSHASAHRAGRGARLTRAVGDSSPCRPWLCVWGTAHDVPLFALWPGRIFTRPQHELAQSATLPTCLSCQLPCSPRKAGGGRLCLRRISSAAVSTRMREYLASCDATSAARSCRSHWSMAGGVRLETKAGSARTPPM